MAAMTVKNWFISKKWYVFSTLLLLVVGFFIFFRSKNTKEIYDYETVKMGTVEETIEIPGKIDAQSKASLRFLAGGRLVGIYVQEGQAVKKYQRIASVDAADIQKNLQKSLNDYLTNRWSFEQAKDDRKDQAYDDEVKRLAEQKQFSLENAVTDVELRSIALKNATLFSPISGVVVSMPAQSAGSSVLSTDVFEIVDPSTLHFDAEVDEVDVGKITIGTDVRIVLDAYPQDSITGRVEYIGLKAQGSTKSSGSTIFPLRVSIPSSDVSKYRLGMNGTLTLILKKSSDVVVVPIEATFSKDGTDFVRVRENGKITERAVTIGIEGNDAVEILQGLKAGEEIALTK